MTSPAIPDYIFMSVFFNSEQECQAALAQVEAEKPITTSCEKVGVWTPKKPTDV
jgi:hypothetical protein